MSNYKDVLFEKKRLVHERKHLCFFKRTIGRYGYSVTNNSLFIYNFYRIPSVYVMMILVKLKINK